MSETLSHLKSTTSIIADPQTFIQPRIDNLEPRFETGHVGNRDDNIEVKPRVEDYASLPIEEAFDWLAILDSVRRVRALPPHPLYLVAFRSLLKQGVDTTALLEHDRRAHEAALESPALIKYHGGTPNTTGLALSFCLWENPEAAKIISRDRRHTDATTMVSNYQKYTIDKYWLHHAENDIRFVQL